MANCFGFSFFRRSQQEYIDEDAEKRVSIDEIDLLSNLPESLLCKVLLNLPTKDVVKTSVLSSRWKHIWRFVPGLDLGYGDFQEYNAFVSFMESFLGFDSESCLQNFKLKCQRLKLKHKWELGELDLDLITWWIDVALRRKVQHLHVLESMLGEDKEVEIPLIVYNCESLVSLKLCDAILPNPKSVSLPSLKVMYLEVVRFANDLAFEMLISGCSTLESLTIKRSACDNIKDLRVCSRSLLSFTHFGHHKEEDLDEDLGVVIEEDLDEELGVVIDAPRLEKLELFGHGTDRFIINNMVSLVKVDINIRFNLSSKRRFDPNDLAKRNMIRNFLSGISRVKDMVISSYTLEVIYNFSTCEQLPLLRNLSSLRADFDNYTWEMLPIFLESCPNLKSLTLILGKSPGDEEGVSILPGPRQFLTSLEYVKIVPPWVEETTEMNLVSYFLENSTILKKFTYFLGGTRRNEESDILKKFLAIPRLSSSCQISVR